MRGGIGAKCNYAKCIYSKLIISQRAKSCIQSKDMIQASRDAGTLRHMISLHE